MVILDAILATTLTIGCGLSLPIWWWLFVTPLVRLAKWRHTRKLDGRQLVNTTPTRAVGHPPTTTSPA